MLAENKAGERGERSAEQRTAAETSIFGKYTDRVKNYFLETAQKKCVEQFMQRSRYMKMPPFCSREIDHPDHRGEPVSIVMGRTRSLSDSVWTEPGPISNPNDVLVHRRLLVGS